MNGKNGAANAGQSATHGGHEWTGVAKNGHEGAANAGQHKEKYIHTREGRAREEAGGSDSDESSQRKKAVRLLRQIKDGEWEGQIQPQEDWQAKMYTCAHPDYNPQSLTKLEWRETISDPQAWAEAILIGIKRGWQPHTIDAREDRYEKIVSGQGRGSGHEASRVGIEEFGSHR
jgi:hypothetical protein